MKITIPGDCPSKKNSRIFSFRGARPMSFPGKKHRQWHQDVSFLLRSPKEFLVPTEIILIFFPQTRRASDLSNKAESIMDLLVDKGFLQDDNWYIVPKLTLIFGGVDKLHPRVEVEFL